MWVGGWALNAATGVLTGDRQGALETDSQRQTHRGEGYGVSGDSSQARLEAT